MLSNDKTYIVIEPLSDVAKNMYKRAIMNNALASDTTPIQSAARIMELSCFGDPGLRGNIVQSVEALSSEINIFIGYDEPLKG